MYNSSTAYAARVTSTVRRMQTANQVENKPVTLNQQRSIMKRQLRAAHMGMTDEQLNIMVDELLPRAMRSYSGSSVSDAGLYDGRTQRTERLKVKKSMKSRRR